MFSIKKYERLQEIEDQRWVLKAEAAAQEGFLTAQESSDFLKGIIRRTKATEERD